MLAASFYINYKKVFVLVVTGDIAKYIKYIIFVKHADVSKKLQC